MRWSEILYWGDKFPVREGVLRCRQRSPFFHPLRFMRSKTCVLAVELPMRRSQRNPHTLHRASTSEIAFLNRLRYHAIPVSRKLNREGRFFTQEKRFPSSPKIA